MTTYELTRNTAIEVITSRLSTMPHSQLSAMLDVLGEKDNRNFTIYASSRTLEKSKWSYKIHTAQEFE